MKLSDFVKQSTVPAKLIRAVVRQVGGWEDFQQIAKDVADHGADDGYKGFIYYVDTVAFTKRNRRAILKFAADQDSEIESVGLVEFVAGFGCIDETEDDIARALYAGRGDAFQEVYNALAWYMLEEVCRSYVDLLD